MRWLLLVVIPCALVACRPDDDFSRDMGARCTINPDCTDLCLAGAVAWPGGLCTSLCTSDDDCGEGAVCAESDERGLVCLYACVDDGDCGFLDPDGVCPYTCQQLPGPGSEPRNVCRGNGPCSQ